MSPLSSILPLVLALQSVAWSAAVVGQVSRSPPTTRRAVVAGVIRVHDGDTFYIGDETIRLRGIDAPELGQPEADAATRRLAALLREGPVTVVRRGQDIYGRTLADVYVNGRDVAEVLRREGFDRRRWWRRRHSSGHQLLPAPVAWARVYTPRRFGRAPARG